MSDRHITAVTFTQMNSDESFRATADIFVVASYEGDLLTQVKHRVDRESRDEYSAPHAGRIFMRFTQKLPSSEQHTANIAEPPTCGSLVSLWRPLRPKAPAKVMEEKLASSQRETNGKTIWYRPMDSTTNRFGS